MVRFSRFLVLGIIFGFILPIVMGVVKQGETVMVHVDVYNSSSGSTGVSGCAPDLIMYYPEHNTTLFNRTAMDTDDRFNWVYNTTMNFPLNGTWLGVVNCTVTTNNPFTYFVKFEVVNVSSADFFQNLTLAVAESNRTLFTKLEAVNASLVTKLDEILVNLTQIRMNTENIANDTSILKNTLATTQKTLNDTQNTLVFTQSTVNSTSNAVTVTQVVVNSTGSTLAFTQSIVNGTAVNVSDVKFNMTQVLVNLTEIRTLSTNTQNLVLVSQRTLNSTSNAVTVTQVVVNSTGSTLAFTQGIVNGTGMNVSDLKLNMTRVLDNLTQIRVNTENIANDTSILKNTLATTQKTLNDTQNTLVFTQLSVNLTGQNVSYALTNLTTIFDTLNRVGGNVSEGLNITNRIYNELNCTVGTFNDSFVCGQLNTVNTTLVGVNGNISTLRDRVQTLNQTLDTLIFLFKVDSDEVEYWVWKLPNPPEGYDGAYTLRMRPKGITQYPTIRLSVPVKSKEDVVLKDELGKTIPFNFEEGFSSSFIEFEAQALPNCATDSDVDSDFNCDTLDHTILLKNVVGGEELALITTLRDEVLSNFGVVTKDLKTIFWVGGASLLVVVFVLGAVTLGKIESHKRQRKEASLKKVYAE